MQTQIQFEFKFQFGCFILSVSPAQSCFFRTLIQAQSTVQALIGRET